MNFPPTPMPKLTWNGQKQQENSQQMQFSKQEIITSPPAQHPKGNILHISNISPLLNYQQIKQGLFQLFSIHGQIYEIVIKTKSSGKHFAFIDYPNIGDTEKAWIASKQKGKVLQGLKLQVNYCEDPKKNQDRKDQKCFICHGTGHKAIRCPVKPQLIKRKQISSNSNFQTEQDCSDLGDFLKNKEFLPECERSQSSESSRSSKSEKKSQKRDKDYLRFLKMKKEILQKRIKKKQKKRNKRKR